ncbi:hypothetical protein PVL30_000089 [Lodderomyces elongisporus]|uniref:uncharacterized protein n=1 Tax=Lodderomyces elongisporus TaxID=36914 RepID=UPI00291CDEB4|nr:uncharacterized protein PVL30_000089 [Lodderomyces elongisporus]WLF76387.1 hypothetical protein PVL30_000089 [Lodderomyces elongisporus]
MSSGQSHPRSNLSTQSNEESPGTIECGDTNTPNSLSHLQPQQKPSFLKNRLKSSQSQLLRPAAQSLSKSSDPHNSDKNLNIALNHPQQFTLASTLASHDRRDTKCFSRTVPTTPMVDPGIESPLIARKHSLGKLNIRSQVFRGNNYFTSPTRRHFNTFRTTGDAIGIGNGVEDGMDNDNNANVNFNSNANYNINNELASLKTSRTFDSLASHMLAASSLNLPSLSTIRDFYNDFTTIDWTKAYLKGNQFNYSLEKKKWIGKHDPSDCTNNGSENNNTSGGNDFLGYKDIQLGKKISTLQKQYFTLGRWLLIVLIGLFFSIIAYVIDKFEIFFVGVKYGYCRTNWLASQIACCTNFDNSIFLSSATQNFSTGEHCSGWISWSDYFKEEWAVPHLKLDYVIYVVLSIISALLACLITLTTKISGGAMDESREKTDKYKHNSKILAPASTTNDITVNMPITTTTTTPATTPATPATPATTPTTPSNNNIKPRVIYTANGSGVPEVKTILSGFVIRRFLGVYTLIAKTAALIFAIASGMSLGKEGPYVHLATCNDFFEKQILSASASAGVALAFGSPLGGVLFILEEINNYLPSHHLFQVFFCAIISTLFLKFLDPYGTGKTVLFELEYSSDWKPIELVFFVLIGMSGGAFGAAFVKFVNWWPKKFRTKRWIKNNPLFEVFLVAALTGIVTFWNPYTKQASAELILDLATSCSGGEPDRSLCPTTRDQYISEIVSLLTAFIVKLVLTFITFGLKLPCGIYVPSMVIGALYGRVLAMCIQFIGLILKDTSTLSFMCMPNSTNCVDMGIYAMISAGAFMAGVTRMNITIVTILFELTSSYTYVLPISIAIAVANWFGGLFEKNSLYESLLIANDYPFMSPETEPIDPMINARDIVGDDVVPKQQQQQEEQYSKQHSHKTVDISVRDLSEVDEKIYIDLSDSDSVSFDVLQQKLILLANKCLLDGCIPLLKNEVCVGLLYFTELEICLDRILSFSQEFGINCENVSCKLLNSTLSPVSSVKLTQPEDYFSYGSTIESIIGQEEFRIIFEDLLDLTKFFDTNPIFVNEDSELSFTHLIFDRIGNRVIVLLRNGKYSGVLHKKVLIDYLRRAAEP